MKRKSSARHLLFSAAAFLFTVCLLSPAAALADDGSAVQQEMDKFGIRPAQQGEETVTGQIHDHTLSFVSYGRDGNYVLNYQDGTSEEVSGKEFTTRYPVFSGVILGDMPTASDPPYYYSGLKDLTLGYGDTKVKVRREFTHRQVMDFSGSSRFGDDIGADYHPYFGFPGEPAGGHPLGTWIHFGRERAQISNDSVLLNALANNDMNTFNTNFENEFGGQPIEEQFGISGAF